MAEQPRTRQELYEQIRQKGGREIFVLEEMIRLGFWKENTGLPDDPAEEIRRTAELSKQLNKLRYKNRKLYNEQALLKELRRKRLAESRQKQKETKERRELERKEKAEAWKRRKEKEIIYLGKDVSAGLDKFESDEERLKQSDLLVINRPEELAKAMKVDVGNLRFLAFSRKTSEVNHYIHFKLPKKTGGFRLISAPKPRLKSAQTWILENILNKVEVNESAHGFLPKKSIVSNAEVHVGSSVIVNVDLENFFPSITYKRVKGVFRSFGYSESITTVLGLICTSPNVEEVEIDGKNYFVGLGERHLPQGSPASPAISNIIARRLDKGIGTIAEKQGFKYTRYADDLTFSTKEKASNIKKLLSQVRYIVKEQGFKINEKKTRILRRGRQQEVTGIVVNDKVSIDRKTLRRFRAVLHQAENKGLEGLHWGNSPDLISSLQGYANFVFMVNKEKGYIFQQQVKRIIEKYDWSPPEPQFTKKAKQLESEENSDNKPWWKLW